MCVVTNNNKIKGSLFSSTISVIFVRIFVNISIIFWLKLKNEKKIENQGAAGFWTWDLWLGSWKLID